MNQSVLNLIAAVERELLLAVVGDSRNPLAEKTSSESTLTSRRTNRRFERSGLFRKELKRC
jgi:hypothetical protein